MYDDSISKMKGATPQWENQIIQDSASDEEGTIAIKGTGVSLQ
jgi:hypothetical protein